jgi:transcriptional regulator with GAF, ATPase, and Fis domain
MEIVGRSPALKQVMEDVQTVGPINATMLIVGETAWNGNI